MASEKITALIEEVKGLTVLELSELVHALEEEFGVLLFSRSGRGLVLPPEPEVAVIPVEDLPAARVCLVRKEGGSSPPAPGSSSAW